MRRSLVLSVCFTLTTLPATVLAQSPAARAPVPMSHSPEFLDRAYVDVDGSYQSHTFSFSDTRQDAWLQETASWTAAYDVKSGPSVLVGGGVRVWRHLIVRASYSAFSDTNAALITGTVPHPFFFNRDRSISGTEGALKQREDVIDIGAAWLIPINRRLDVRAFGGPSFFQLKRDLLTDVTYRDEYPYDTAEFSGVSRTEIKNSTTGFHVGADVTYRITGVLGVGGTVRFSRATFTLTSPADAASLSIDAGGLQIGGGLRLRFGGSQPKAKSPDTKKGQATGSSSLPPSPPLVESPPVAEPPPAPEPTHPPAEAAGPPPLTAPPSGTEAAGAATRAINPPVEGSRRTEPGAAPVITSADRSEHPSTPATAAAQRYSGLPNVTGYDATLLKAALGPPVATTSRKGILSWSYATPDGDRSVYLVNGLAVMTRPVKTEGGASYPPGCRAAEPARAVTVIASETPAFVAPRVRSEALVRLASGTLLTVIRVSGAWFAVNLPNGASGYVHCSDVQPRH